MEGKPVKTENKRYPARRILAFAAVLVLLAGPGRTGAAAADQTEDIPAPSADTLEPVEQAFGTGTLYIYNISLKLVFSVAVVSVILAGFLVLTDGERGTERAAKILTRCAAVILAVYLAPVLVGIIQDAYRNTGSYSLWGGLRL